MRLIDADALIAQAEEEMFAYEADQFAAMVSWIPTIDAVPVVRCKECKHWEDGWLGYCTKCHVAMAYDSFCSYGEKRDE